MKKEFDIKEEDYTKEKKHPILRLFFMIILFISLTIVYSRYVATSGLLVKEYPIKSNNITDSYNGFKIAHFSDVHYGNTTFLEELKVLVNDINKTKPDIIIFTGDLIDKSYSISDDEISLIMEELKKLNSTYGNYYVDGEHDKEFEKYHEIFDSANFINLNNNYDVIYNKNNETIFISGVDVDKNLDFLNEALKDKTYNYKINIMHYPDYYEDIEVYNYDLILSGHSHNGQIVIPFYGAVYTEENAKKYYKPHYKVNDSDLYISSGVGTSIYKFRLFNRPSYNLYRLLKK